MQRSTRIGITLLSALALIAAAWAGAGEETIIWSRTYGGPDADDTAYAVVPGQEGFLLAGVTASSGEGKTDAWVIGLTAEGRPEWNRTYGGKEADTARAIVRTDDGGLLFAGNLTYVTNGTQADTDAWLVKIDPSGAEAWNRTYGGPDVNASANAVIPAGDGGFLFVGSTATLEGSESDAWAVRVNETGGEVWRRVLGGAGNDTMNAAARLPDGDFVVAGSTESSGAGMADVWVIRLDRSGGEVWNRTFGSPDDDAGRAVITTPDGNLLIAGTFTERPDNATVDTDALLIKLTPAGDTLWNWVYGEPGVDESAAAVTRTADGGYLFAGETGYPGTDDTDAWLVKTDADGAVVWSRTFGGENPGDRALSVLEIAEGEYLFAGAFNATEKGGVANTDAWAVRLGPAPAPAPTPTVAPIKPPKAPVVQQKPPVAVSPAPPPAPTPTIKPTEKPTKPTEKPTVKPTEKPTKKPIEKPPEKPIERPTLKPPKKPIGKPTIPIWPKPTHTVKPTERPGDDDDRNALSGTVWYDLNADGSRTSGEPGIPGISVRLIGQRTMVDAAVTGPDGSYRFATIPAGDYTGVEFLLPDGYACTLPGQGSDARPMATDVAFAEALDGRQTLDAGLVGDYRAATPATAYGWVLGTTWSDDDQNGIKDETSGLTDVEVRLIDAGGDPVAKTRTGYHDRYTSLYLFGPLLPGEYSLAFSPPDGYVFTAAGGDSHADPSDGTTPLFTLAGSETVVRDAGLIPAAAGKTTGGVGGGSDNATAGESPAVTLAPENKTAGDSSAVTPGPDNATAGDGGLTPPAEEPPSPEGGDRTASGSPSTD